MSPKRRREIVLPQLFAFIGTILSVIGIFIARAPLIYSLLCFISCSLIYNGWRMVEVIIESRNDPR